MRLRADAQRLEAAGPDVVAGLFPGIYRSLFRGRGLDFEEVRAYQQGDDFRLLDWRVTARTGRPHTKVFREEREHTVHFVIDNGPSMRFASRGVFKWVAACRACALIAWLAADNGDRIGGVVFGDGPRVHEQRPLTGRTGALRLFRLMEHASAIRPDAHSAPLSEALGRLRRHARPGSLVLIACDFRSLDSRAREELSYLAKYCDVAALYVYDPLERDLPEKGTYTFTDGETVLTLDTSDRSLKGTFAALFNGHRDAVAAICARYGVRWGEITTDGDPVASLRDALLRPSGRGGRNLG